jgi:soluble lytic murein transglycosylase-like protein
MTTIAQLQRLPQRVAQWAPITFDCSERFLLDPILVLSIIERESKGGEALDTGRADGRGDGGHGRGLMQIDDRSHAEWIDRARWWEPDKNIEYGCIVLRQSILICTGHVPAGIAGYNAGPKRALRVLKRVNGMPENVVIKALDAITTRDYVSGVLEIRRAFSEIVHSNEEEKCSD